MAILSRHLENDDYANNVIVGTPSTQENEITLSRKVRSELNLAGLERNWMDDSVTRSVESGFSGKGDPLPDEVEPLPVMVEPAVDLDAFVALQELGTLVARKRGIDAKKFLTGLMQLYSMGPDNADRAMDYEMPSENTNASSVEPIASPDDTPSTTERILRHTSSQPQLKSTQRCRRHFSFEPGDDQVTALEEQLAAYEIEDPSSSEEPGVAAVRRTVSSRRNRSPNADIPKPSKIPSPALQQTGLKSVRREGSDSSVRTALKRRDTEERRDSRSSVLTQFRQNTSGSLRLEMQSRSNSVRTLQRDEDHQSSSARWLGSRHNVAAIAAARAVDQADNSVCKKKTVQSSSMAAVV